MYNLLKSSHETGFQPWADMYVNGHVEHWRAAAAYVLRNQGIWNRPSYTTRLVVTAQ
jgi:hypothetical protein